jgi:iron complex outermembrane recepter protein
MKVYIKHIKLKKMELKTIIAIIIILAALFATITLVASEPDTLQLEEILVKGKAFGNITKSNISGNIINMENHHDGGAMFLNQVGFGVEKRGNYGMEPVLRGFKYSQLNVLIDGGVHTTNACPNRMDPAISQVSMEEIEKIEVIKGPYSVRYGQSFGGIINIVNRKPDRNEQKAVIGAFDAGYQSNGGNFFSNLFVQGVKGKFDFSLNAGYKDYGNYKSGSGQKIASSFTRSGYALKFGFNPKENQRLQLSWRQSKAEDVLYAGLPMDADMDKSSILSLDYAASHLSQNISSFKLKLYGSYVDHVMSNTNRPAYKASQAVSPVNATVLGGRTEFGISSGTSNLLFAGVDFKHIAKDGHRDRLVFKNTCTGMIFDPPKAFVDKTWQDSKHNDFGLFFENKLMVSQNLVWTLGLRSDFISYSINDPENSFSEVYNNEITPDSRIDVSATTSLSWYLPNNFNLYFAAARASRAPELSELFINHLSIGMDAYEYLGNPNLKSEVNYQTDLRAEKRVGDLLVFADVFYAYITDYISASVDSTIPRMYMPCMNPKFTKKFTNIDKVFLTGFETGLDYNITPELIYNLGLSYTYGQNVSWDEPLAEITPITLVSSIMWKSEKLTARLNGRAVGKQDRVSTSFDEGTTPGFAVFDFYAAYKPFKMLELNLSVKNLADKNYVEHLSRAYKAMDVESLYYEPGRSFNIGLRLVF